LIWQGCCFYEIKQIANRGWLQSNQKKKLAVKTLNHQTTETAQSQTLLRWRWIILFASITFVATVEGLEHQELELNLAREFLLYGLAVPICTWLLLTLLARQMSQQTALSKDLEQHRQISRQLAHYQDRNELARFVTRFPGTMLPIERATLFQYDHLKAEMEFVDEWNANGQTGTSAHYTPRAANAQYAWQLAQAHGLHQACSCPLITGSPDEDAAQHFCLPLVYDRMLVGLLRLRSVPGQSLPNQQMQFLNTIAPHVALALALSIAFPRQVTEAQRSERRRLAYELHDSLAQQIGYLHLTLDRLAEDERLEHADWLRTELDRLREVANESYLEIRNNLALLRDEEPMDLTQTIEDYVHSIAPHVPLALEFDSTGTPVSLGPLACQHILGLIQESLNNIQKHARAQRVCLALRWHADRLDITVADDGTGFDLATAQVNGHYGLSMLRERTQALRGEMQITSVPDAGTSLQFQIPLRTP
jgi:nitrate/nitrite-specific signal transduction histidine kinase